MAAIFAGQAQGVVREESRPANRLLLVSNRGPVEHFLDEDGNLGRRSTDGGVATALSAIAENTDVDWVACASSIADGAIARRGQRVRLGRGSRLAFAAPPAVAYDLFYNTFCNPILWFLQHGIQDRLEGPNLQARAQQSWQLGYLPVNQSIAEVVAEALRGRIDHVMFHDYHFYMAPLFVRNYHPRATLQHFVHIPWPEPETWAALPRKIVESICRGLLANDSVVFQTQDSVDHFLATCAVYLDGIDVEYPDGLVATRERRTRVWSNPISVDPVDLHRRLLTDEAQGVSARLERESGQRTIVRVDRMDPSKNVKAGFEAYEGLLDMHPEWRGRVRFLAFLVPSRESIPEYAAYAAETLAAAERVNSRFATSDWEPLKVYYEHNRLQALAALRLYDVLLVNSLADGMNLVSKEGAVLNERQGVMVLSRSAGSYAELGGAAIGIDPDDVGATAEGLHLALTMPPAERAARAEALRNIVLRRPISRWLDTQLEDMGMAAAGAVPVLEPV